MKLMNNLECTIEDMTCNGCVKRITQAIHKLDENATISTDLTTKNVTIQSELADQSSISKALSAIGYEPQFKN